MAIEDAHDECMRRELQRSDGDMSVNFLLTPLLAGAKGGALVSLIHGNTNNGDSFVRGFTDQLLEEVSLHPLSFRLLPWLIYSPFRSPSRSSRPSYAG